MTAAQEGVYLRLFRYAWREGSIPRTTRELAAIARVETSEFQRLWPGIAQCWSEDPENQDRLIEPYLEGIRAEAEERAERQRAKSAAGGRAKAKADRARKEDAERKRAERAKKAEALLEIDPPPGFGSRPRTEQDPSHSITTGSGPSLPEACPGHAQGEVQEQNTSLAATTEHRSGSLPNPDLAAIAEAVLLEEEALSSPPAGEGGHSGREVRSGSVSNRSIERNADAEEAVPSGPSAPLYGADTVLPVEERIALFTELQTIYPKSIRANERNETERVWLRVTGPIDAAGGASTHDILDGARRFRVYTEGAGVCRLPLLHFLEYDAWKRVWHPDDAWVETSIRNVRELEYERDRLDYRRRHPELYADEAA